MASRSFAHRVGQWSASRPRSKGQCPPGLQQHGGRGCPASANHSHMYNVMEGEQAMRQDGEYATATRRGGRPGAAAGGLGSSSIPLNTGISTPAIKSISGLLLMTGEGPVFENPSASTRGWKRCLLFRSSTPSPTPNMRGRQGILYRVPSAADRAGFEVPFGKVKAT